MKLKFTITSLLLSATVLPAQSLITSDITVDTFWGDDPAEQVAVVLDGPIFVKNGATLTILPGTIVRGQPRRGVGAAVGTASGSLIITQSGQIEALGTPVNPIIFTTAAIDNENNGIGDGIPDAGAPGFLAGWSAGASFYDADPVNAPLGQTAAGPISGNTISSGALTPLLDNDNTELWGGLVILGEAPTNLPDTGFGPGIGFIEGLPPSSDTLYGGIRANDNSGILQYVSVRHGGDQIGTSNEINGITLAGVGFGTTIEYCEVYMNYEDGFEWLGGTVNANHLVVTCAGDDSFECDLGWTGQVQFAFVVQTWLRVGRAGGDEACEFDGGSGGFPHPSSAFANLTIIGPTGAAGYISSVAGNVNTAGNANGRITLRNNFIGDFFNVFAVNGTSDVVDFQPTANFAYIDTLTYNDYPGGISGNPITANIIAQFGTPTGLLGEDPNSFGGLNPRPAFIGFPPAVGFTSSITLPAPFRSTAYVGAFSTTTALDLWTTGWTALNIAGVLVD